MYCAHCGRQNADEMLFCGYCGKPLATPEPGDPTHDEEMRALYGRPEESSPREKDPAAPRRASTIVPAREAPRKAAPADPFALEAEAPRRPARPAARRKAPAEAEREAAPAESGPRRPPVLNRAAPVNAQGGRAARTVIPRREAEFDGDDLFMDDGREDGEVPVREERRPAKRRGYAYEEAEKGGFFVRHIRGLVSLFLLVMVAAVVAMWAWSPAGQRVLAQLNISRQPEAYARIAEEMGRTGSREMEGYYYARALQCDPDNLDYAILMANAYIASGNIARATEALERVIRLQPDDVDAYLLLSGLYPVVNTRPEGVRALICQGYERTGDSRLSQ